MPPTFPDLSKKALALERRFDFPLVISFSPRRGASPSQLNFPKNTDGVLLALKGSLGPFERPRRETQHTVVISVDVASFVGQNEPGTREMCTFSKCAFFIILSSFSNIGVPPRREAHFTLLGLSLAGLRAPFGGLPGPKNNPKVAATLRPDFSAVLRLPTGNRTSTKP